MFHKQYSEKDVGSRKETSSPASVTSGEVARPIKAVTNPFTPQLAHLCELMQELRNEQAHRRREETASSRAASSSTGSAGRSDIETIDASLQWAQFKEFILLFSV